MFRRLCARGARTGARSRIGIGSDASWLSATVARRHGSVTRARAAFAARTARVCGFEISQQLLPDSVILYADSEPGGGLEKRGRTGAHLVFCGFGVATLFGRAPWLTGPPVAAGEESGCAERSSSARG